MIRPPRTIDAVLNALGAEADYRDDLLGDLTEEFGMRAQRDGEVAARWWYRREAARAVPHLVRNWGKSLRLTDVVDLVGVVVTSYVILVMVAMFVMAMIRAVLTSFGVVPPSSLFEQPLLFALGIILGAIAGVFGGYVAATLHVRAPLVGSVALGAAWSAVGLIALGITGGGPLWYRIAAPILVMLGTTTGGVLRVRATADPVQVA